MFQQKIQLNLSLWANFNEERKKFIQVVNKLFPKQENLEYQRILPVLLKDKNVIDIISFQSKRGGQSWQESEIH